MANILEFKHYLIAGVISYTFIDLTDCIGHFSFLNDMIIYSIAYTIISFTMHKIITKKKLK